VDDRILNAADYGDATTRVRLFIMGRRGNRAVNWPLPTHPRKDWKAARGIIDWSLKGESIFSRKRPLAGPTMRRILAGLEKFGGQELAPFIVVLRNNQDAASIDKPLSTICTSGAHHGIAEPFIVPFFGERSGQDPRIHSVDAPTPTITSHGAGALVQPFILPHRQFDRMDVDSIDDPVRTFTAKGGSDFGLVEPFILPIDQQSTEGGARSTELPLGTVTTKARFALAEPFLTKYYGTQEIAHSVDKPLDTVTTKDRLALVMPERDGRRLDIRFRMLQPHELAAAMGFSPEYEFSGNRGQQVKQIGNAVCVNLAKALIGELIRESKEVREVA
jgi:DNA (cytosine-5)-methyltransferase 1